MPSRAPGGPRRGSRIPQPGKMYMHSSHLEGRQKRSWRTDLNRLSRQISAGRSITLYRGERVRRPLTRIGDSADGGGSRLRRLRAPKRDESWTTNPRHALTFASMGYRPGTAGLLYSIQVPAQELASAVGSAQTLGYGSSLIPGDWTLQKDIGQLEVRPRRDRPDLKPKIVGSIARDRYGIPRLGLARRLHRGRGGAPARGGGA